MKKFITFNTKAQALNFIKRNKGYNYRHHEGCGCCFSQSILFLDESKLVLSKVNSYAGNVTASAIIVGKIKNCR